MCFPLVLARAVCILREGWKGEGGEGRLVVRLCSEYIFFFNNSWDAVVGDGGGVGWGAKPGHG